MLPDLQFKLELGVRIIKCNTATESVGIEQSNYNARRMYTRSGIFGDDVKGWEMKAVS